MNKSFFTADTHFGHANIIGYCNRPFPTPERMDEAMITNWNSVVPPDGLVYHLGDFAFWKTSARYSPREYRDRLNGSIILIRGNHDKKIDQFRSCFESIHGILNISVGDQDIVLCHYAMRVWDKSHRGAWQLYGHSHGTLADDPHALAIDVGVDCHKFTPISFNRVAEIMAKKKYKPVDHHKPRT